MNAKRARGRFYTAGNPFTLAPFREWATQAGLPDKRVLEPFAGANGLIRMLRELSLCSDFAAYDIEPGDPAVRRRDAFAAEAVFGQSSPPVPRAAYPSRPKPPGSAAHP